MIEDRRVPTAITPILARNDDDASVLRLNISFAPVFVVSGRLAKRIHSADVVVAKGRFVDHSNWRLGDHDAKATQTPSAELQCVSKALATVRHEKDARFGLQRTLSRPPSRSGPESIAGGHPLPKSGLATEHMKRETAGSWSRTSGQLDLQRQRP
jgi:hypothetical protein